MRFIWILTGLVVLGLVSVADACLCTSNWESAAERADAIFVGYLPVSHPPLGEDAQLPRIGSLTHTFHVSQGWRGVSSDTIRVKCNSDGASCGYRFREGVQYLVLARIINGELWTSSCDHPTPLAEALLGRFLLGPPTESFAAEDFPPVTIDTLFARLGDSDETTRVAAADALGALKDVADETVSRLVEVLLGRQPGDPYLATRALGALGSAATQATPALLEALASQDGRLRARAVQALGSTTCEPLDVVEGLLRALHDPEPRVRASAPDAIFAIHYYVGGFGPKTQVVMQSLIANLGDPDSGVRASTVLTVGMLGAPAASALPKVRALLNDPDYSVRQEAEEAVYRLEHPENEEPVRTRRCP